MFQGCFIKDICTVAHVSQHSTDAVLKTEEDLIWKEEKLVIKLLNNNEWKPLFL